MGLFDIFRKKKTTTAETAAQENCAPTENTVSESVSQPLEMTTQEKRELTYEEKCRVFTMQLLMSEPCQNVDAQTAKRILHERLGNVEYKASEPGGFNCFCSDYAAQTKGGNVPPMLLCTQCFDFDANAIVDEMTRSQMWDCPEHEEILARCKYQVFASDLLAGAMDAKSRAQMLTSYAGALLEMYPQCEAVFFPSSGKLLTADRIRSLDMEGIDRFIAMAVNVRYFRIQDSEDMIVDTLGMNVISMPDLQYHFHAMEPNWIVNHAYNVLSYIAANDNPIKDGDTIDGVDNGRMSSSVMWRCRYEQSLVPPEREVIDVFMNANASGTRGDGSADDAMNTKDFANKD